VSTWKREELLNATSLLPVHQAFGWRSEVKGCHNIRSVRELGLHFFSRNVLYFVNNQLPLPTAPCPYASCNISDFQNIRY
jgi:hypothetical protein